VGAVAGARAAGPEGAGVRQLLLRLLLAHGLPEDLLAALARRWRWAEAKGMSTMLRHVAAAATHHQALVPLRCHQALQHCTAIRSFLFQRCLRRPVAYSGAKQVRVPYF